MAILLKLGLRYKHLFSECCHNAYEILVTDVFVSSQKFRVIAVYRTPSCSVGNSFQLHKCISDFSVCEHPILCLGDFNYPSIDWLTDQRSDYESAVENWLETIENCGMKQFVREPTRQNSVLDLIFSNDDKFIQQCKVVAPIGTSDHNSVLFELTIEHTVEPSVYVKSFGSADFEKIRSYLSNINWMGSFSSVKTLNEMYELFLTILNHTIDIFVPLKLVRPSASNLPDHLQNLSAYREALWQRAQSIDTPSLWDEYSVCTAKFVKALNKYNRFVENKMLSKATSQEVYKLVNKKLGKCKDMSCLIDLNGKTYVSDLEKANLLAESFVKVFSSDNGKLPSFDFPVTVPDTPLYFNRMDIESILRKWPNSFSVTPDEIPFKFIKEVHSVISEPLELIFNISLIRSQVPNRWKHSYVTAIPKKAPLTDPGNYRPISLTSIFARAFEKLLKKHVVRHLERNNIIPEQQHGFRAGKSVETQMLECVNDWSLAIDKNSCTDVVYFDFSKAFDRVSHVKLLHRLKTLRFHISIVNWITSFLSERTFQVTIGRAKSEVHKITSGVPQGGVLSPILFSIYTCEVPEMLSIGGRVRCKVFADDTKVYQSFPPDQTTDHLQTAINKMYEWSQDWQLPLAVEKTKMMHIGKNNPKRNYVISCSDVEKVSTMRDLGFIIDESLNFADHCKRISRLAKRRTFNLFKSLKVKKQDVLVKLYKTYVRPIVESGCTVFNSDKGAVKALESVQNDFTRKLFMRKGGYTYCKVPSSEVRNRILGLTSLLSRRDRFDLVMVHKILTGQIGLKPSNFYTFSNSRTRGSNSKLSFPIPKTKLRQQFFSVRAGSKYLKLSKKKTLPFSVAGLKRIIT